MADIRNEVDLADELIWERLLKDLGAKDGIDASLWSPPCPTFSPARRLPVRLLRGHEGPDLYGLQGLTPKEKEQVRIGTLLAKRAAQGIKAQRLAGRPWVLESPVPREGFASLFRLPEVIEACGESCVTTDFVQCELGALSQEPTELQSDFVLPEGLKDQCNHERRWWRLPPRGDWLRAAHPPWQGDIVQFRLLPSLAFHPLGGLARESLSRRLRLRTRACSTHSLPRRSSTRSPRGR